LNNKHILIYISTNIIYELLLQNTFKVNNIKENLSIMSFICHRIPERTFQIKGYYFPICSRCTGIYTGAFLYFLIVYTLPVYYNIELILLGIVFITPTFFDGTTQFLGHRKSNNWLRFSTGLLAGIGMGILVKTIKFHIIIR